MEQSKFENVGYIDIAFVQVVREKFGNLLHGFHWNMANENSDIVGWYWTVDNHHIKDTNNKIYETYIRFMAEQL
jgi:hypothetical protein